MPKPPPIIIDAHAHCGIIDRSFPQTFDDYARQAAATDIHGVVLFSPVQEIYDRYDPRFSDTPVWQRRRRESNARLLALKPAGMTIYPYLFIWNDFAVEQLTDAHCGIKWHRHPDEPVYHYDEPRCRAALEVIRKRQLPVVLEEELPNTIHFIRQMAAGIPVIIPHLGMLNGGYQAIADAGLWSLDRVWADTALAAPAEIREYLRRYGHRRLIFGSDFPFGDPFAELASVRSLNLDPMVEKDVLGGNFRRLQADIRRIPSG